MAKSRQLETVLEQIKAIGRLETLSEADIAVLRKILKGKQVSAIAPTTKLIVRHQLTQLIPEMKATFNRLLTHGADRDPSCKAKWAIANTLYQLEHGNSQDAKDALMALDIYRHTTEIWQQINSLVQFRGEPALMGMI